MVPALPDLDGEHRALIKAAEDTARSNRRSIRAEACMCRLGGTEQRCVCGKVRRDETWHAVLCCARTEKKETLRMECRHSHLKRNVSHRALACCCLHCSAARASAALSLTAIQILKKCRHTRDRTCLSERREALIAVPHARCSEGSLSRRHRRNHTPTSASAFSAADAELRKLLLGRMQLGREREVLRAQRRVLRLQDLRVAL